MKRLGCVVVLVVGLAGCSGSNHQSAKPRPTTTTEPATTTTRSPNPRVDKALAESAVLTLADLPAGWTAAPHARVVAPGFDQKIATCLHVPLTAIDTDRVPHAESQYSLRLGGATIASGVAVFGSASAARAALDARAEPDAPSCFAAAHADDPQMKNLAFSKVTGAFLTIRPVGEPAIAIRLVTTTQGSAFSTLDTVTAQRGRAIAFLVGSSGVSTTTLRSVPPELTTEVALLAKVVARLGPATT